MNTFKIPFGPQHPALEEPLNFTFEVEEERVVDVKLRLGYVHRGIEKMQHKDNKIRSEEPAIRVNKSYRPSKST